MWDVQKLLWGAKLWFLASGEQGTRAEIAVKVKLAG